MSTGSVGLDGMREYASSLKERRVSASPGFLYFIQKVEDHSRKYLFGVSKGLNSDR